MSAGLSLQQAERIYSLLVEHAGASERQRQHFVYQESKEYVPEWRFMGSLGFGGKFWRTPGTRPDGTWGEVWRVDCYREDETAARRSAITETNLALDTLRLAIAAEESQP